MREMADVRLRGRRSRTTSPDEQTVPIVAHTHVSVAAAWEGRTTGICDEKARAAGGGVNVAGERLYGGEGGGEGGGGGVRENQLRRWLEKV